MTVYDLNNEQLIELKTNLYSEENENVSYSELANIDNLVSDDEVYDAFGGIDFSEDDFFCTTE